MKYNVNDKVRFFEHGHTGNVIKGVVTEIKEEDYEGCGHTLVIDEFDTNNTWLVNESFVTTL